MEEGYMRVALIANDEDDVEFYKDLLSDYHDMKLEIFNSIHQFRESCDGKLYSGVIIDTRTRISSTTLSKKFFYTLCGGIPVIQINRNRDETADFSCLVEGKRSYGMSGRELLDEFIRKDCKKMIPRRIRIIHRKSVFFNIQLYLTENSQPIKTNMLDVSEKGCFIITTEQKQKGEKVWLTVKELENKTPICSVIKWVKPWGTEPKQLPGFGVSFDQISKAQIMGIMDAQAEKQSREY